MRTPSALAAALLALLLAGCSAALTPPEEVARAGLLLSAEARPPSDAEPWTSVALPDPWKNRRPGVHGAAWYRVEVGAPPGRGDAGVYLTRTLSNAQLWVNGRLAGQLGDFQGRAPDRWAQHHLFPVPRALWRDGTNVLHLRIVVPEGTYGGIGTILVGDHDGLEAYALRHQFARSLAPAVTSVAMVLMGGFILLLWLRRREDRLYGYFAVGTILWGLHTGVSLLPDPPLPSPHYEIWWNVVYMLFVALLAIFSVRFAGVRRPAFERACFAFVAASVVVLYAASAFDAQVVTARYVRLGGIAIAAAALVMIVGRAVRSRDPASWILLGSVAVAAAFGVHDWLAAIDPDDLLVIEWTPYVALFFVLLMGWMMVDRFVRTLNEYERLNVELEARVAEKSRALEVELARQAEARREAETANLAKSRFLAAASHDLRQPLHALGFFAEALDAKTRDEEARALVHRIRESILALESLFSEVLDISKLDAGAVEAKPQPMALQPLFDRIASDLVPEAVGRELALRFAPTRLAVQSDPVLLERVLRNLVSNALRYTNAGGVVVGARRRGQRVAIEVHDSGVGIPEAEQQRVFEEFYQVANPERDRRKGLGLGLAIVKRLCDLLGHRVELRSVPGRGTRFTVWLGRATQPAAAEPRAPIVAVPGAGARVLVLDDEEAVREGTGSLLRSWGFEATLAATPAEAAAVSPPPRAMIVDVRLRGGANGVEAARELRSRWGLDIPVVLVSGESSPEELARMQASGFTVLHKPVAPAKLRSLLAHLLARDR